MFYEPAQGHDLPHNPFKSIVAPRPIGWISTRSDQGIDNLAPYSFFNAVADDPPQVIFASSATKDSLINIRTNGVFCVNIVSREMADAMNVSSAPLPANQDEFNVAHLDKAPCETINCARVASAPAALECRMDQVITLQGADNHMVLGTVVGVYIDDAYLRNGLLDVTLYQPLARLGYMDYAAIDKVFSLRRPT